MSQEPVVPAISLKRGCRGCAVAGLFSLFYEMNTDSQYHEALVRHHPAPKNVVLTASAHRPTGSSSFGAVSQHATISSSQSSVASGEIQAEHAAVQGLKAGREVPKKGRWDPRVAVVASGRL